MTVKRLRTFLGVVGPILAAIAPWVAPFFDFKLISDYYQPSLNRLASVLGVMALLGALAFTHNKAAEKKKRLAKRCLAGATLSFVLCLVFKNTVGVLWAPGIVMNQVVRITWVLVYLLFYGFLFVALCEIGMLVPVKEPKSDEPAARENKPKPKPI